MMELTWSKKINQLRRLALRQVKNPADADDIVQDTVIAAVVRGGFGTESHLSLFLGKVLRNKVADYFRKMKTGKEVALPEPVLTSEAGAGKQDLAKEYEIKEILRQLDVVLSKLGDTDRYLIDLLVDGCPTEEICERLNISMEALRVRRFRLKSRIKWLLGRRGGNINASNETRDNL